MLYGLLKVVFNVMGCSFVWEYVLKVWVNMLLFGVFWIDVVEVWLDKG